MVKLALLGKELVVAAGCPLLLPLELVDAVEELGEGGGQLEEAMGEIERQRSCGFWDLLGNLSGREAVDA